jgi:hypothetical protein
LEDDGAVTKKDQHIDLSKPLALTLVDVDVTDPALNNATICGEFHPMKHGAN